MIDLYKHSYLARLIALLTLWYREGAFCRAGKRLAAYYSISRTRTLVERFAWTENRAITGRYGAAFASLRDICVRIGDILRQSLFYRLLCAVRSGFYRISEGSIVLSALKKLGLKRLVIICFAFYMPIDYVMRNVLPIPFLASVWDELFIIFGIGFVLWRRMLRQSDALRRETPLDGYLLLFIGIGFFLMCAVSPSMSIAIDGYRAVVQYLVWFFIMIRLIEDDGDFKTFYFSFLVMSLFIGAHGVYQYIVGVPIPASWVAQAEMGVRTRVFSITGSPNVLGSFLVMAAPFSAALIYYFKNKWLKLLAWGMTGGMLLALLFTFSRGAWVGIVVTVLLFSLLVDRRLILLMGAGIAGILVAVPSITSRIQFLFTSDYVEASTRGGRSIRWETGMNLLHDANEFLGFGLGRFGGAVAMQNKVIEETEEFKYFYMDNYYLKTAVEMGYLGLAIFIVLLIGLILWCLRSVIRSRLAGNGNYVLICGMFSGLCGVLTHCYFENIFEVPYMVAYFWGIAAAVLYVGLFQNKRQSAARSD